ncbi:MAG: hypothetical protein EBQ92_10115 [Proteobacteria bacterium]|nr:hypothetical protein [Pseudomonadota bacterium]
MITRILKACSLFTAILFHFLVASSLLVLLPDSSYRRHLLMKWMHHCSRIILHLLDIDFWIEDRTHYHPPNGTLFLANHVSYIDALILAAQYPSVFVTSNEVKETFFLGWLARCAGCIFVERRGLSGLKENVSEIRQLLASGLNVIIFPEGTTGNGSQVLPFKNSLLEAAVGLEAEVRPICVNYRYCNGEPISPQTSRLLFYYGEMKLLDQLAHLLAVSEVVVELILLPPLSASEQSSRKTLALASRESIAQAFKPILETTVAVLIVFLFLATPRTFASAPLKQLIAQGDSAFGRRNHKDTLEKALTFYEQAWQKSPETSEAAWKYSMALHSLATRFTSDDSAQRDLFEKGLEIARQAAVKEPNCGQCQFWTAIHMAQYGEKVGVFKMISSLSEIKERLEQAALLNPEHAMAGPYRVLGTIYQSLPGILGGDNEKAATYFQKAIATSPNEAINYLSMAKLKAQEGESIAAREIAQAGLQTKELGKEPISLESEESFFELQKLLTDCTTGIAPD